MARKRTLLGRVGVRSTAEAVRLAVTAGMSVAGSPFPLPHR